MKKIDIFLSATTYKVLDGVWSRNKNPDNI